jgi:hypothetical protein
MSWLRGLHLGNLDHLIQLVSAIFSCDCDHSLICLDLADAPIESPPLSEEEMEVDDPMMLEHDCRQTFFFENLI